MKIKMKGKIKYMIIFGVIFTILPILWKFLFYTFVPITYFIEFNKLDFQDYKQWDNIQVLYSYRDSKFDTIWDFYYKVYCNKMTNPEWVYNTPDILLERTDWEKIIKVHMPIVLDLPKWNCRIEADITIKVEWYTKYEHLTDYFVIK
jgi:hypothetical protein